MKIKGISIALVIFLIMILSLVMFMNRPIQAQGSGSDVEISKKLDEILKNQKEILQAMASVKQDLEVIKIRVTR